LPLNKSCLWEIALSKLNELPAKYETVALCSDKELVEIAATFENIKIIFRDDATTNKYEELKKGRI
jgi:hypothetical protein